MLNKMKSLFGSISSAYSRHFFAKNMNNFSKNFGRFSPLQSNQDDHIFHQANKESGRNPIHSVL